MDSYEGGVFGILMEVLGFLGDFLDIDGDFGGWGIFGC